MYRTDLLAKRPLLSVTALMESQDKDGTLARCSVCVPATRNRYSWFHGLFYSQGSSQLKCLSLLFNDTSRQTITHRGVGGNKRETNKLAVVALFVLPDETCMVWNFPLVRVKAKSITAKIRGIILQPWRKYYFFGWLVLSLIFLSTHHYRDMEALGTRASHCLPSDERGFPV